MKFLRSLLIVLVMVCLGEVLNRLIPLPIPASVYGMVLLFIALLTGVVKVDKVKPAASFLLEIMPLLFIPSVAALPSIWPQLAPYVGPVAIIAVATTLMVLAACGWAAQGVVRRKGGPHE